LTVDAGSGSASARANVKSIPLGVPFLQTLVNGCLKGGLGINFPTGDRDFSAATIYVPTRRAARALAHAFADALKQRTVLLPRIVPLGDPSDLEESAILSGSGFDHDLLMSRASGSSGDVLPAIGVLERQLQLARLIEGWRNSRSLADLAAAGDGFSIGGSFADSFALAGALAALIDEFALEGIDWQRIKTLNDGQYDRYWALTREFLAIAGEAWPLALQADRLSDPATRLDRLLRAEAARLRTTRPDHPVIAAGSTGTVPATAELLAAIARLPNGVVVLPGLDTSMDARGWALVADQPLPGEAQPGHPQAALKRLLSRLGIDRDGVDELGAPTPTLQKRAVIIQAAGRAAEATDDWPDLRREQAGSMDDALAGISVIEAPDERTEALAIAVALRGVLKNVGETAALVTPDRALAQRVSLELQRWGIKADDSAGTPLAASPLGALARLIIAAVAEDFTPVAAMAVLSHPCAFEGSEEAARTLEILGLRGNDVGLGLEGFSRILDNAEARIGNRHSPRPVRRIPADALEQARLLLSSFTAALQPLSACQTGAFRLAELARIHAGAIEAVAGGRASVGADAKALGSVFDEMASVSAKDLVSLPDYAGIFETLLAGRTIAPQTPAQGRIKIWGLLEARLMEADLIVLGGLNEGVWPGEIRSDPFLNRSMRAELGLPSPERRVGQSAHDFAQALGARRAVIARAMTVEGQPMVASRFLRRLDAFVGAAAAKATRERGRWMIASAAELDNAPKVAAAARPDPRPDAALQPVTLSITEIKTLVRDPYAIYARHILDLQPLEPLDAGVDGRDRGNIFHEVLAEFVDSCARQWPDDPLAELLRLGRKGFEPYAHVEAVSAFWWPVFEKVAAWFVGWEKERRSTMVASAVEKNGVLILPLEDGTSFKLRARADRIDTAGDGTIAVVDYKTGAPPSGKQIMLGLDPQLTLTAYMASHGLFETVAGGKIGAASHVRLGTESEEIRPKIDRKEVTIEEIEAKAAFHVAGLKRTLERLRRKDEGFQSRKRMELTGDKGDYDHLARVREWTAEAEE
jgi:ATP-dependent helicase/nuclease subunit B